MKFYPSDWQSDQALGVCSLAARGLWMEMLAIMHKATPYGHLLVNGLATTDDQLAALARAPADQVRSLLQELESAGVFSRNRNRVIYSRRMTKDEKRRKDGVKSAENGQITGSRRNKQIVDITRKKLPPPRFAALPPSHPYARGHIPDPNERPPPSTNGTECDQIVERLVQAANGNVVNGATGIEVIRPILDLQAQGCDLERDIVPVIQAVVPKLEKPLRTWGARFLRDAILAKQAERLRGRGATNTKPVSDEEKWNAQLRAWKDGKGMWHENWGPRPNADGCRIPKEFLDRFRSENGTTAA